MNDITNSGRRTHVVFNKARLFFLGLIIPPQLFCAADATSTAGDWTGTIETQTSLVSDGSSGSQLEFQPGAAFDRKQPHSPVRNLRAQSIQVQSIAPTESHAVRIAYVIPSNRVPQTHGVANLQNAIFQGQNWYRDQMERHGFGAKTFAFETELDGVTPKVHTVTVIETDDYLRGDIWGRTIQAASNAGVPIWATKEVWWIVPEIHLQAPDGSIAGGIFLGAGIGSGDSSGGGMFGSDALARFEPGYLTDDSAYHGETVAAIGPYPLVQSVSFPWFEGTTFSSISSSVLGGAVHELSHGFGLAHDFRNDRNFNGNLMGHGLRGWRGSLHPERYPSDYTRAGYGAALALSVSRYFNSEATFTDSTEPVLNVTTAVLPLNGLLNINFTASDNSGLAAALLQWNGDVVDEMALSGTFVNKTFATSYYNPGQPNSYTVSVLDTQGKKVTSNTSISPSTGLNRAPQPLILISSPTTELNQSVILDASLSTDPDGDNALLQVEWDLDGDGQFDTAPSTTQILNHLFTTPGDRLVRARLTDPLGAQTVSAPLAVRVLPSLIVGRHIFYNDSAFDGSEPLPSADDDDALAGDKTALLPGQTATAANYTSYSRGINGLMVDIVGLPAMPTANDFFFKIGNDSAPDGWSIGTDPDSIDLRIGAGNGGADRITLIWPDNAIQNQWLQVTVKATANTGLATEDVFYFGNAIGESTGNGTVNVPDVGLTRQAAGQSASSSSLYDHDRSSVVNVVDVARARGNAGFTLVLFQAP